MNEHASKGQSVAPVPNEKPESGLKPWEKIRLLIPESIADLLYPSVRPLTMAERRRETEKRNNTCSEIDTRIASWNNWDELARSQAFANVEKLAENEYSIRDSVQARLNAVLGMASVAISVTLGVAGFLLGKAEVAMGGWFLVGISLTALFVAIQLVIVVRAAVVGLQRDSFRVLNIFDLLPVDSEDVNAVKKRIVETHLHQIEDLREATNRSVTQMAIAHTALKNACLGITLAIVFLGAGAVLPSESQEDPPIEKRIINRIRSDPELADFLRGPRGPRGERGERGLQGEQDLPCTPAPVGSSQPQVP